MAQLKKVRVQLLDPETGSLIEDVDIVTSADSVSFTDGETFQQKLDLGKLKGEKGDQGDMIKVGMDLVSTTEKKLFFKVIG
ncbi:hypothetical protein [Paraclostridium bifermentans]|uniref:hypothetical protein n=1 Tax=Paraclostridium bifermentans TaxID=1490 RepID=UPI00189F8688|nr:hypothetical protein [Paraclostridium bifermentans]